MDGKMNQVDDQIKKLQKEFYENKKSTEEIHTKLENVVAITKTLIEEVIKPIVNSIPNTSETIVQTIETLMFILKNQCGNTQSDEYTIMSIPSNQGESKLAQTQVQLQPITTN